MSDAGALVVREAEYMEPVPHNREGEQPAIAFDEETQIAALNKAFNEGKSIVVVCKQMGIHRSTLGRWIKEMEEEVSTDARAQDVGFIKALGAKMNQLIDALTTEKLTKASPRDIAIAFGILADKRRDIMGPQTKDDGISLKIAWKDGAGAVELTTSGAKRT